MKSYNQRREEILQDKEKDIKKELEGLQEEFWSLHPLGITVARDNMQYFISIPKSNGVLFFEKNLDFPNMKPKAYYMPSHKGDHPKKQFYVLKCDKIPVKDIVLALYGNDEFITLFNIAKLEQKSFTIMSKIRMEEDWMVTVMKELLNNLGKPYGLKVILTYSQEEVF